MSTQLSPQIRVFALVGVLLIAVAGGGFFYLKHRSTQGAVTLPTSTTATTQATTPAATTQATTPAATTPSKPAPPAAPAVKVDQRLPLVLQTALQQQPVVVVGLYDPQVPVDRLSLTEARAGAAQAGVGFVQVSLLNNRVAGTLTALLPSGNLLPAPGILIYRRPGKLVYRFDGYLDRNAIALAASSAG